MTFPSPARPLPTRTQPGPQYQFIATAETCLFYACPVYKLWGAGPVLMWRSALPLPRTWSPHREPAALLHLLPS